MRGVLLLRIVTSTWSGLVQTQGIHLWPLSPFVVRRRPSLSIAVVRPLAVPGATFQAPVRLSFQVRKATPEKEPLCGHSVVLQYV